jgi:twitching motility protein PilT
MDLDGLLARLIELGGSDLHLKAASPAMVRIDGDLQATDERLLTEDDLVTVLQLVTDRTPAKREQFLELGDLDTSYVAARIGRFRVNGFRQRGAISFAFRFVPKEIPSFEKLGLPDGVAHLAREQRGLVLVTGATGSGKSTTVASLISWINKNRRCHIVTIEDPIEFIHDDWASIVNQREVGLDTESFKQALRRVLRQDPDVIFLGELRDEETAQTALQAAESGHLVLSTLHTLDARETVGRLVEFFPTEKQVMARQVIAGVLRGVVCQRLVPRKSGGRVAAVEVLVNTARIADLIRDPSKTHEIARAIEDGSFHEMQSFSQHLVELVVGGTVERDVAAAAATNSHDFNIAVDHALRHKRIAEGEEQAEEKPSDAGGQEDSLPALRLARAEG